MTLSGTESGVEALCDRDLLQYESYTTRARATLLPPTASGVLANGAVLCPGRLTISAVRAADESSQMRLRSKLWRRSTPRRDHHAEALQSSTLAVPALAP